MHQGQIIHSQACALFWNFKIMGVSHPLFILITQGMPLFDLHIKHNSLLQYQASSFHTRILKFQNQPLYVV